MTTATVRHIDYKRYVAPMRYRLAPADRGRLIKLAGCHLRSREAFVRRLLSGED